MIVWDVENDDSDEDDYLDYFYRLFDSDDDQEYFWNEMSYRRFETTNRWL